MPLINIGGEKKQKQKQSLEKVNNGSKRQNLLLKNISSSKGMDSLLFTPIHFPYLPTFKIKHKRTAIIIAVLFLVLAVFSTSFIVYGASYADKVFPKINLGMFEVGGKTEKEVKDILQKEISDYVENNIALVCTESKQEDANGKNWNSTLEELGFTPQIDQTVEKVFELGREDSISSRVQNRFLSLFVSQTVKIEYDLKEDVLESYLTAISQEVDTPYTNAILTLEEDQIKIASPENGYGVQTKELKKEIRDSLEILENKNISLPFDITEPKIKEEDANQAKEEAENMISTPIILNYEDKVYTADYNVIFSWIKFEEVEIEAINPLSPGNVYGIDDSELSEQSSWTLQVLLDDEKIREYVDGIANDVNILKVDQRVLDNETERVLKWGQDGKKLNTDQTIIEIKIRIENEDSSQKSFNLPVETEEFQIVKVKPASNGAIPLSDGKYIDISLSRQTVTCFINGESVYSTACSSGTWQHPTPTGTFSIYYKIVSTRMRGYYGPGNPDNYDLPNVPYAMFFYGDYSMHGTYWHSNFGTPMSHGCVNLSTPAAGWIYNWAPNGTTVIVH